MLGGEVTLDEWDDTHKRRKIVRHVRINVDLPTWLKKTVGLKEIVFVQTSVIDAINKTMVIHNVNQTWSDKLCIGDDCEYVATGSDETIFHQKAFFKLPSIPMVKKIEGLLSKSYEKNTGEGRLMDHAFVKDAMDAGFVNQVLHNPATGQPNETWSVIKDINAQGKKVSKNGKPRKSGVHRYSVFSISRILICDHRKLRSGPKIRARSPVMKAAVSTLTTRKALKQPRTHLS